jgi:methylmalonyl-CoA mutase N-terminal domain/subunit
VLGGTQSLHTNSMDEALGLPTEQSVRVALRTQQIISHETGAADTVDPLAGSYYVEHLTDEIERRSEAYLDVIQELGGALAAVESGYIQNEIHEAAYRTQQQIERQDTVVVGVNAYRSEESELLAPVSVDPAIEVAQREHLEKLRSSREQELAAQLLDQLQDTAQGDANLMPVFIACAEADVTLGEMCGKLREVWGEYRPVES